MPAIRCGQAVHRGLAVVDGQQVVAARREVDGQRADRAADLERARVALARQAGEGDRRACAARTTRPRPTGRPVAVHPVQRVVPGGSAGSRTTSTSRSKCASSAGPSSTSSPGRSRAARPGWRARRWPPLRRRGPRRSSGEPRGLRPTAGRPRHPSATARRGTPAAARRYVGRRSRRPGPRPRGRGARRRARAREQHVVTVGPDRVDERGDELLLVVGQRAVGEAEAGHVPRPGRGRRGPSQLLPRRTSASRSGGGSVSAGGSPRRPSRTTTSTLPARARGGVHQSTRTERLVVGVCADDDHRPASTAGARGSARSARVPTTTAAVVPGRSCRKRGAVTRRRPPGRRGAAAEGGLVALGVPLPQVELEVGHPACVLLVGGQRARAEFVRGTSQDVLGAPRHHLTHAQRGPRAPSFRAVAGVEAAAACLPARHRAACSAASTAPRCMRATWSGPRRRAATIRRATPTAPPYQTAATPIPPHAKPGRSRYHPGSPTARRARRRSRPDRSRRRGKPARHPRARTRPSPRASQVDREELSLLAHPRAHQRVVELAAERAPVLASVEAVRRPSASPATARPAPRRRRRPTSRGRPPRPPGRGWRARPGAARAPARRSGPRRRRWRGPTTGAPGDPHPEPAAAAHVRASSSAARTSPLRPWPARTARRARAVARPSWLRARRAGYRPLHLSRGRRAICPPGSRATSRRVALRAEQDATSAHAPSGTSQGLVVVLVCRQACAA